MTYTEEGLGGSLPNPTRAALSASLAHTGNLGLPLKWLQGLQEAGHSVPPRFVRLSLPILLPSAVSSVSGRNLSSSVALGRQQDSVVCVPFGQSSREPHTQTHAHVLVNKYTSKHSFI